MMEIFTAGLVGAGLGIGIFCWLLAIIFEVRLIKHLRALARIRRRKARMTHT